MTRVPAHYVQREMALVGLCELALSMTLIYALLAWPEAPFRLIGGAFSAGRSEIPLAAGIALSIVLTAATIGLYRPDISLAPRRLMITAAVAGIIASPIILWVCGSGFVASQGGRIVWLTKVLGIWFAVVVATRLTFGAVAHKTLFPRRVLVVGTGPRAARIFDLLRQRHAGLFQPILASGEVGELTLDGLRRQSIWGVIVAGDPPETTAAALLDGKLRGVKIFSDSGFHDRQLGRVELTSLDTAAFLTCDGFATGRMSDAIKRVFDLISSCLLLVATLPLMLITAALIKLDSPGPVFYRQQRAGLLGVPFVLLKFRSMATDAEAGGKPRWAQRHDPRITRIGRFIRQTRIDELPQLLNVLRGDMSMVGPRPERPHFVEELALAIPFYNQRAYVKPGITGWAQINYPYGASVEDAREKLAYDLYYLKNRGLLLDILIFCSTVRVVLLREGAR